MRTILIYMLTFLIVIPTLARNVDEKTAIKVANKMLFKNHWDKKEIIGIKPLLKNNDTLIYIVSFSPEGFAIISADNSAPPILGQCKNAKYEPEIMPPGLIYLIENYQYSISKLKETKSLPTKEVNDQWAEFLTDNNILKSYSIGNHLVQTTWSQQQ